MSLKNWLEEIEETEHRDTSKEELIEAFNIWFQEEGKFQVPQGDYLAIKELLLIAWLNGAHKERYHNI